MAKKMQYSRDQRYHKVHDGSIKPCTASVRACPYSIHYDSIDDAQSPRQRVSSFVSPKQIVTFESNINSNREEGNLREASGRARNTFLATGKRASSPLGDIRAELPAGQRIELRRETYDKATTPKKVLGVRYRMRYFSNEKTYEETFVDLNTRIDHEVFMKKLDDYYTAASDLAATKGVIDDEQFISSYKKTIQNVSEIEVMARGVGTTIKYLGIDVFESGDSDTLKLDTNYYNSTLTTIDITESLKEHSILDKKIKDIEIRVSDYMPGNHEDKWHIERIGEGGWYVGSNSSRGVIAQNAKDADDAVELLGYIFDGHEVPVEKQAPIKEYVYHMIKDSESAIKSYESTVKTRLENTENDLINRGYHFDDSSTINSGVNQSAPTINQVRERNQGNNIGAKISRLFG